MNHGLPEGHCYHPGAETDAEVRAECAANARADLRLGMKCHCCPKCGWDHGRGWVDGVDTYRCLRCGIMVSPRNFREVLGEKAMDMTEPTVTQNEDGTVTIDGETGMPMYVVYDHPRDYPGHFVVRPHLIQKEGKPAIRSPNGYLFDDLDSARQFIPIGMVRINRDPSDDPVIVESYI